MLTVGIQLVDVLHHDTRFVEGITAYLQKTRSLKKVHYTFATVNVQCFPLIGNPMGLYKRKP